MDDNKLKVTTPEHVLRRRELSRQERRGLPAMPFDFDDHSAALEIPRAIDRAELELLTNRQIVSRIVSRWRDPDASIVLDWLDPATLTKRQKARLLAHMQDLVGLLDELPGKERTRVDRIVYRLLFHLDIPEAFEFALSCLQHRRTMIRKAAYRFIRVQSAPVTLVRPLIEHYTKPGWPRRILGSAATGRVLGLRGDVPPRARTPLKMRHGPEGLVLP